MTPRALDVFVGARRPHLVVHGCIAILLVTLLPRVATARAQPDSIPQPGSELTVYLMTMGPGDAIWENFGHNAIVIRDALRGTEIAYNWGVFDFDEPGYVWRFIRGEMMYWMEGRPLATTLPVYEARNRSVWLQELALTPAQRAALRDFVEWNERPENRSYRYDYYRDNCSTRVRDALDQALGGLLSRSLGGEETGTAYRFHALRLTAQNVPIQAGIHFGLGPYADRPIDAWEESFIPMRLQAYVRDVRVPDGADGTIPLVVSEHTLFEATRAPEREAPPNRFGYYLITGLVIAGLILLAGRNAHRPTGLTTFTLLGSLWALVCGVFGLVLVFLWAFTDHASAYANQNLFHMNPLSLSLVIALPIFAFGSGRPAGIPRAIALAVAGLSVLGMLLDALPAFAQWNAEFIALALPPHLAVLAVLMRWPAQEVAVGSPRAWRARAARAQGRHR